MKNWSEPPKGIASEMFVGFPHLTSSRFPPKSQQLSWFPGLVNIQKANWKMAIEIVDLPLNSMVIFHSYVNVYQRVPIIHSILTIFINFSIQQFRSVADEPGILI